MARPPQQIGQDVDVMLQRMDHALEAMHAAQGSIVKLPKAELGILVQMEKARDVMNDMLMHPDAGRASLREVFGGDCRRIAHIRAVLDAAVFSQMYAGDQRLTTCKNSCASVEQVLKDLGLGMKLQEAQHAEAVRVARCKMMKVPQMMNVIGAFTHAATQHASLSLPVSAAQEQVFPASPQSMNPAQLSPNGGGSHLLSRPQSPSPSSRFNHSLTPTGRPSPLSNQSFRTPLVAPVLPVSPVSPVAPATPLACLSQHCGTPLGASTLIPAASPPTLASQHCGTPLGASTTTPTLPLPSQHCGTPLAASTTMPDVSPTALTSQHCGTPLGASTPVPIVPLASQHCGTPLAASTTIPDVGPPASTSQHCGTPMGASTTIPATGAQPSSVQPQMSPAITNPMTAPQPSLTIPVADGQPPVACQVIPATGGASPANFRPSAPVTHGGHPPFAPQPLQASVTSPVAQGAPPAYSQPSASVTAPVAGGQPLVVQNPFFGTPGTVPGSVPGLSRPEETSNPGSRPDQITPAILPTQAPLTNVINQVQPLHFVASPPPFTVVQPPQYVMQPPGSCQQQFYAPQNPAPTPIQGQPGNQFGLQGYGHWEQNQTFAGLEWHYDINAPPKNGGRVIDIRPYEGPLPTGAFHTEWKWVHDGYKQVPLNPRGSV